MKENLTLIKHPIILDKLSRLRDKKCNSSEFRNLMSEISRYLAFEATADLEMDTIEIETPLAKDSFSRVKTFPMVISILRAGNGMLDGALSVLTGAQAGHIGIYRDKFINNTVEYYFRIPGDSEGKNAILLDPVIATADTIVAAVDRLKQYGLQNITILTITVAESGVEKLFHFHPDVKVFALSIESSIDKTGLLVPGIGDVGSRLYNN